MSDQEGEGEGGGGGGRQRLYKCEKCGAAFTDPEMLEKHRKEHKDSAGTGAAEVIVMPPAQPPEGQPPPQQPPPATTPSPPKP